MNCHTCAQPLLDGYVTDWGRRYHWLCLSGMDVLPEAVLRQAGATVPVTSGDPCLLHNIYTPMNPTPNCTRCGAPATEGQRLRWEAKLADKAARP
jgi:hypothetical protein